MSRHGTCFDGSGNIERKTMIIHNLTRPETRFINRKFIAFNLNGKE